VLGSLFGGATGWGAAGNWLAANPGGYIGLWDEGGYTGPGGKYEAAGIVHKGEYVLDADTVMRAGGPHALDGLRKGLRGYADGGFVGAPVAPAANQNSRTAPIVNLNVINNAGASVQTQERQEPDGSMTLDVIVDRVVAEKLNTRGTATNNTLRQGFGAQQALKRR
jgi:phage-related minor tail protein